MVQSTYLRAVTLCFLLLLLASAGCVGRNSSDELSSKYRQDGEELIDHDYVPRDDGQPLTADELKAFRSLGEMDRKLSQEETAIVEMHFKYFVHSHRSTMQRFVERTARYLPYMRKTFNDRGIPEEIVYLSMVESGGNPNAVSRAGAAGLWQFMPYTGRLYGLSQNRWIDERRDPFKATYAASDYLLKLRGDFSNWHLAIAAYNAGEGKIGRAVEGTGAKDFFELCRLNGNLESKLQLKDETRNYVPRFIAMAKIMRNLRLLGFTEPDPGAAYDLTAFDVPPGTNLSALARNVGLTWDEFSGMNPGYRRTASPPTMTTTAYLPATMVAQAQASMTSGDSRLYADWREYTVKRGDTIASIAKRNRTSVAALKEANGFDKLPGVGTEIMIPGKSTAQDYAAYDDGAPTTAGSAGKYTVRSGDTLFSLAQDWNSSVESIRRTNRLDSDSLTVGRRLIIPADAKTPRSPARPAREPREPREPGDPPRVSAAAYTGTHTVRPGDTLSEVCRLYGANLPELCAVNGITPKTQLQVGRKIKVPAAPKAEAEPAAKPAQDNKPTQATKPGQAKPAADAKPTPTPTPDAKPTQAKPVADAKPAAGGAKSVRVAKGDTLYSLARKNNVSVDDLCKANGMTPKSPLKLGATLRLP